ncbi:MAG TPA: type II secretion system protein GspG [Kiritimatiellia bacterium]|nr:type II secretion system protein GspG [Kiritimatiellia bacterium]
MRKNNRNLGFTLVEILVTTAIIGILIGIVLGITGMASRKSDESRAVAEMQKISNALEAYRIAYGRYPANLSTLLDASANYDVETKDIKLTDPWGRDYQYERNPVGGVTFKLWSQGARATDTSDDIYSTMGTY